MVSRNRRSGAGPASTKKNAGAASSQPQLKAPPIQDPKDVMAELVEIKKALVSAVGYHNVLDAKFGDILDELDTVYVQKRSRIKNEQSLAKKLLDRRQTKSEYCLGDVTDVIGFRFVCHFTKEVQVVVEALLKMIVPGEDSDLQYLREAKMYASTSPHHRLARDGLQKVFDHHLADLNSPSKTVKLVVEEKDSRYTSVHLVVERKRTGQKFEVQVRNVFEDAWAEIEHALNYKGKALTGSVKQHLQVLNSYAQACSEYSEQILADAEREGPEGSPQVREVDAREYMENMPADVKRAYEQAAALMKDRKFDEAVVPLSDFIVKNESVLTDPDIRYFLLMERALIYLKLKEPQLAIKDYQLLIKDHPNRSLIYWRLGDAHRIDGDYGEAASYFEQAIDKLADPVNTPQERRHLATWPYSLAHAYWRQKGPDQAAKALSVLRKAHADGIIPHRDEKEDPATGKKRDHGELVYTNSLVYYLWEIMRTEKRRPNATEKKEFEAAYRVLKAHHVDDGSHWEPLDTLMVVCDALGKKEEAQKYAMQLESITVYNYEKEIWRVRLRVNGKEELQEMPRVEIDMVKGHIHDVRFKPAA